LIINCEVVLFDHWLWMLENADPMFDSDSLEELAKLCVLRVFKILVAPRSLMYVSVCWVVLGFWKISSFVESHSSFLNYTSLLWCLQLFCNCITDFCSNLVLSCVICLINAIKMLLKWCMCMIIKERVTYHNTSITNHRTSLHNNLQSWDS